MKIPNSLFKIARSAFSVIQLLLVVAIIGVLVALMLPATQKVREASSRTAALSNAKQVALAMHKNAEGPDEPLAAKIIYNANLSLIVVDFEEAEVELAKRVKENKGFVAQSDITGVTGEPRNGHWTVRLPVDHFEPFMEAVNKLGVVQTNARDSQSVLDTKDVSEEYADVEGRLKNKKAEEERLLKHLDKSTGNLQDILAVERELTRVRGEIEQSQRRLKVLQNLTALATVTIAMHEDRSLAFLDNVRITFAHSLDHLASFGKQIALAAVAAVPWLAVVSIVVISCWPFIRRWTQRKSTNLGVAS
jgi:hypothetical protein